MFSVQFRCRLASVIAALNFFAINQAFLLSLPEAVYQERLQQFATNAAPSFTDTIGEFINDATIKYPLQGPTATQYPSTLEKALLYKPSIDAVRSVGTILVDALGAIDKADLVLILNQPRGKKMASSENLHAYTLLLSQMWDLVKQLGTKEITAVSNLWQQPAEVYSQQVEANIWIVINNLVEVFQQNQAWRTPEGMLGLIYGGVPALSADGFRVLDTDVRAARVEALGDLEEAIEGILKAISAIEYQILLLPNTMKNNEVTRIYEPYLDRAFQMANKFKEDMTALKALFRDASIDMEAYWDDSSAGSDGNEDGDEDDQIDLGSQGQGDGQEDDDDDSDIDEDSDDDDSEYGGDSYSDSTNISSNNSPS